MTAVAHATAANVGSTATAVLPPKAAGDPLANEETFLKLLVSQLKNQDPLKPPDTSQFVGQLTAYSQLEQLIAFARTPRQPEPARTPSLLPQQLQAPNNQQGRVNHVDIIFKCSFRPEGQCLRH